MDGHHGPALHRVTTTATNHVSAIATIVVILKCVVEMLTATVLKHRRSNA